MFFVLHCLLYCLLIPLGITRAYSSHRPSQAAFKTKPTTQAGQAQDLAAGAALAWFKMLLGLQGWGGGGGGHILSVFLEKQINVAVNTQKCGRL